MGIGPFKGFQILAKLIEIFCKFFECQKVEDATEGVNKWNQRIDKDIQS